MKIFLALIVVLFFSSCDSNGDPKEKLKAAECEQIQDREACKDRGCVYQHGRIVFTEVVPKN